MAERAENTEAQLGAGQAVALTEQLNYWYAALGWPRYTPADSQAPPPDQGRASPATQGGWNRPLGQ